MPSYPDISIGNQWTLGELVDAIKLHARVDAALDLVAARVVDGGWVTPTLGNSWAAFGAPFQTPQYRVKAGIVYLAGLMKSGTSTTAVFTLPAGARPANTIQFGVASNGGVAVIRITAAGVVSVNSYLAPGSNADVTLNGIQFIAEQ